MLQVVWVWVHVDLLATGQIISLIHRAFSIDLKLQKVNQRRLCQIALPKAQQDLVLLQLQELAAEVTWVCMPLREGRPGKEWA